MLKVTWVKADTGWLHRKPCWLPVYLPPHIDPEISAAGLRLHYHIAWNRISAGARPKTLLKYDVASLTQYAVFADTIIEFDHERSAPIVGPPAPSKNLTFDCWRYYLDRDGRLPTWPPAEVFHGPVNIGRGSEGFGFAGRLE